MNLFAAASLSVGIACVMLSAITICFGRTRLHRRLLSFNFFVAIWGIGCFLAGIAQTEGEAILGWKIASSGGVIIGPVFYHLVISFCAKNRNKLLVFGYTTAAILGAVVFITDYVISSTRFAFDMHYQDANVLYGMAVCFYLAFVLLSYYELVKFARKTSGLKRTQTYYIIIGFLFGFTGANFTFLPMFGIDAIYPFGNFGITVYTFIITFAIFRYRLMDIHLIFKKTLAYSLSAGLLTGLFLLLVIGLTKLFTTTAGQTSHAATITAALAIAILFDPLNKKVHSVLDRVFYRTKYDYCTAIQDLSRQLAITTDLASTYTLIADSLLSLLNLKNITILSESDGYFQSVYLRSAGTCSCSGLEAERGGDARQASLSWESPLVRLLEKKSRMVILEEISNIRSHEHIEETCSEFKRFKGKIAVPVFIEGRMSVIVMLGEKRSEDIFTQEDINLFETVANQSAIAIRNAQLYNDLELRVEERTAELTLANEQLQIEIAERMHAEKELAEAQKQIVDTAHKAGMADIATGILHDLGNVLNSVNSSTEEITHIVNTSKVNSLMNANQLLKEHLDHIGEFFTSDDKGRKLPGFYLKLGDVLLEENNSIGKSVKRIEEKIHTMKGIVETQQDYARAEFHSEQEELPKIIHDVLKIQKDLIASNGVHVTGDYEKPLRCRVHKYKLVQVLLNLVKNAVESMKGNDFSNKTKELIIETGRIDDGNDFITVMDNGCGIPRENLIKIFNHGFTTKDKGHGFGLHSSANAMTEMGGSITVESNGDNKGAVFTVKLPV